MKMTPKMALDSLRLVSKHKMTHKDDDDDTKAFLQGMAATYLEQKREGKTTLEFPQWIEEADLEELTDKDEESEEEAEEVDPQ